MENSITAVRFAIAGGTDEERRELTDAIMYLLIEHGLNVTGMKEWDN